MEQCHAPHKVVLNQAIKLLGTNGIKSKQHNQKTQA